MINKNTLDMLEAYGFGADVDSFESYVIRLIEAAASGSPEVTDAQYDDYVHLLKELKPESEVFKRNWESEDIELDDTDIMLKKYGMKSIRTIQDMKELQYFVELMGDDEYTMCASSKINGHGVRAVYNDGVLISGSTRGRYKKGRDITRHLKQVLPDNIPDLEGTGLVEIRGELYVSWDNFEKVRNTLKTPLSSVTSLSRESATEQDISLLSFAAYNIFGDNIELPTLFDKFQFLGQCGFETPFCAKVSGINKDNFWDFIKNVLAYFEKHVKETGDPYDSDGIVVAIDSIEDFYNLGDEGNTMLGNFALKIGHWESNVYSSTIEDIIWCYGKRYITPKAVVTGVITRNGSEVTTVPLYNIGVMQDNGYYPGETVYFRYGGETGVQCVRPDGTPVNG